MGQRSRANSLLRNLVLVVVLAWAGWQYFQDQGTFQNLPAPTSESNNQALKQAFHRQQSDIWLIVEGRVKRVLRDDNEGSRHQRFILETEPNLTILVAHNIDLAESVPLKSGDHIRLRGEYEWNPKGGVIHWTHRDPGRRHAGGWIEHNNKRYD